MGNVDYDMAAICHKIYLEHKKAIYDIARYGRGPHFAGILFKEIIEESELFENIYCNFKIEGGCFITCLPRGIDDTVKEKLYTPDMSWAVYWADYFYFIQFSIFPYGDKNAYFILDCTNNNNKFDDEYKKRSKSFKKSLEKELNIKINPKMGDFYFNNGEPLFSLDILKLGDKEKIKTEMKKRFDEKCAPYIEKFVSAINKAEIV